MDYFYVVDEWPLPPGVTNKASHYYTALGGKGANCAVSGALMNGNVSFTG